MNKCPVCGMPVKEIRDIKGRLDHYEPITFNELRLASNADIELPGVDPETKERLINERKGKKTVALVGMATTSCGYAPFDDPNVEIWGLNEAHKFKWFKRWDRWFQIHSSDSFKRSMAKRNITGHYEWLRTDHKKKIYMQHYWNEVPSCVEYPIVEVSKSISKLKRGNKSVKYFTSTFAYMMGVAILEGFERIEIYGFEFSDNIEYVMQKACGEFWIGVALGKGIEIYTPDNCEICHSSMYGGEEQGDGWNGEGIA